DWVHRPENEGKHYELERGEVVEVSRPGERHGATCANVVRILGNYTFQARRGYVCGNDTGIIWERDPDTVRGPDALLYRENRRFTDPNPRYSDDPPTLVVEVQSPNDRPTKITRRLTQFLTWGTPLAWLLDPEEKTVTVYRPDRAPQVLG